MRVVALAVSMSIAVALVACAASTTPNDDGSQESELRKDASADGDARNDARLGTPASVFVDPRDDQSYRTTTIGGQTWLAQNLAFVTPSGSFCYADDPKSCERDGRLYTLTAARNACPASWHLPSDGDWKKLETSLGMPARDLELEGYETARGSNQGTVLKRADGFAAHMAGFRTDGTYDALGDRTYFWTATTRGSDVWRRRVAAAEPTIFRFTNPPASFAISVRCVKDDL